MREGERPRGTIHRPVASNIAQERTQRSIGSRHRSHSRLLYGQSWTLVCTHRYSGMMICMYWRSETATCTHNDDGTKICMFDGFIPLGRACGWKLQRLTTIRTETSIYSV